jgi:hypothetical protein
VANEGSNPLHTRPHIDVPGEVFSVWNLVPSHLMATPRRCVRASADASGVDQKSLAELTRVVSHRRSRSSASKRGMGHDAPDHENRGTAVAAQILSSGMTDLVAQLSEIRFPPGAAPKHGGDLGDDDPADIAMMGPKMTRRQGCYAALWPQFASASNPVLS